MPDFDLRALTLGPAFKPKVEDIPTPDLLGQQGAPADLLRLVSLSAEERLATAAAYGSDEAFNMALLVCRVVRYRDSGGDDGNGSPVYALSDASAMTTQDFELLNMWALVVKPFLGIDVPVAQAVEQAKNDSVATPSSDGGTESPTPLASPPSENASPDSEIVTS